MLELDIETSVGSFDLVAKLPADGGTTIIIGPNGAGKSTLLKALLGVITPRRGSIELDGRTLLSTADGINVPIEDRRIGYVPQKYALFSHLDVIGNVGFGIRGVSKEARKERVMTLLEDLGIAELADRRTRSLSGGEAQRVALARALAIGPSALLLDEPMAALDAGARRKVRTFLGERLETIGIPCIVVSHDANDVETLGDRVAVLDRGRIAQLGTLTELRERPATNFVRDFLCSNDESKTGS